MSNTTTRTPEPQEPETMPDGWPPKRGAVGDHVRRWLAWYVLGASLLTLAGLAWTIVEVRAIRQLRGSIDREKTHEETR